MNREFAQQAYIFSEPFVARSKGGDPHSLLVADIGFNPYASVLIATEEAIAEQTDIVAAMVRASVAGWNHYLRDPDQTNRHIHQLNPEMGMDILAYGAQESKPLILDATARISTDIVKINYLRDNDNWSLSKLYYLFLWGEILLGTVILLVGFLVLGPGRSIDMARRTGKVLGDLRRTFAEVTDAISTEQSGHGYKDLQSPGPPPGVPTRPDIPDQDAHGPDAHGREGFGQDAHASENPEPPQGGTGSGRV